MIYNAKSDGFITKNDPFEATFDRKENKEKKYTYDCIILLGNDTANMIHLIAIF